MISSFLDWVFGDSGAAELDRLLADEQRQELQALQEAISGPHGGNAELAAATARLVLNANFPKPDAFAASLMLTFLQRCDDRGIPHPHDNIIIEMYVATALFYHQEQFNRLLPDLPADDDPGYAVAIGRARDFLLRQQIKALQPAETLAALSNALIETYITIARHLPPLAHPAEDAPASSQAKIPLIDILPGVGAVIERALEPFSSPEAARYGLFRDVREQLKHNAAKLAERLRAKHPPTPSEYNATPSEIVHAYLDHVFLDAVFLDSRFPFYLPQEQRFSGHWIIAPPGRGKTTLLHSMFLDDVKRDGSIIVMDSKGDLINPIKNLQCVADRLLLIEPDEDYPLALNPLDIPKSHVAHTISLIEYIMSALLEAKFTSLQSTLFRNVIPAIIETIPDATLQTFKAVITHGFKPNQEYFSTLDRRTQAFFLDKENGFHSKTYVDTRNQIIWRLDYLMTNPVMRAMFAASKTKLDLGKEMDAGKIIIINNSKALLTDEGAEFFGRFFIALILAAAQQRATKKPSQKLPCYVYIDECHNVIARDPKVPTILDECRSQKIALILAHQRTAQLTAPVLDAISNCAIRMANSDDEAKYLDDKLRTTTDFIRSLPRGTFATFVRDLTRTALALKVPFVDMDDLPKMSAQQQADIQARTRTQFGHAPALEESPPSLAEHYPAPYRPKEPKPAPESAAANVPKPPPAPAKTDPHTGDHTEPASKWGE